MVKDALRRGSAERAIVLQEARHGFPRWPMAFLSAASIWAKVSSRPSGMKRGRIRTRRPRQASRRCALPRGPRSRFRLLLVTKATVPSGHHAPARPPAHEQPSCSAPGSLADPAYRAEYTPGRPFRAFTSSRYHRPCTAGRRALMHMARLLQGILLQRWHLNSGSSLRMPRSAGTRTRTAAGSISSISFLLPGLPVQITSTFMP